MQQELKGRYRHARQVFDGESEVFHARNVSGSRGQGKKRASTVI